MIVKQMLEQKLKGHPNEWYLKDELVREFKTNQSTMRCAFNSLSSWDDNYKKKYETSTRTISTMNGTRKATTDRLYYGYFPESKE